MDVFGSAASTFISFLIETGRFVRSVSNCWSHFVLMKFSRELSLQNRSHCSSRSLAKSQGTAVALQGQD